jgi:hypothetical protein
MPDKALARQPITVAGQRGEEEFVIAESEQQLGFTAAFSAHYSADPWSTSMGYVGFVHARYQRGDEKG